MSSTALFAARYHPTNLCLLGRNQFIWSHGSWQALLGSAAWLWGGQELLKSYLMQTARIYQMLQNSLHVSQNGHWNQRHGGVSQRSGRAPSTTRESVGGLGAGRCVVRGRTQLGTSASERGLLIQYLCCEVRTWSNPQWSHFHCLSLNDE